MLILWLYQHALIILGYIIIAFVIVKSLMLLFMVGTHDFFGLLLGSMTIVNKHDIRNTFDESLKTYLKVSNKVNVIFYSLMLLAIFTFFFTAQLRPRININTTNP